MSTSRGNGPRPVETRWLTGAALVGAGMTGCLAAGFWFFNMQFSGVEVLLWPTSILLMALANPVPWTDIVLVWAIAAVSNVVLYVVLASLLSLLSYPVRKV